MSKKNNKTDVVMTERQRAEAKEAKSLKIMTFSFVVIVVLCLSILIGSVTINPIKPITNSSSISVKRCFFILFISDFLLKSQYSCVLYNLIQVFSSGHLLNMQKKR